MKRILCVVLAIVTCFALACPAFAAEGEFVPSITYKPSPEIVPEKDPNGEDAVGVVKDKDGNIIDYVYGPCLVITPVSEAETSTLIPQDAKETLLDVYEALSTGMMALPYDKYNADLNPKEMAIRDLFDASWLCADHPIMVAPEGVTVTVTFDLGVDANEAVYCMTYMDSQWAPIVSVKNNGDGTVTCVFEDFCPVAFSVRSKTPPSQTGDEVGRTMYIWIAVMVASAAAVVVLLAVGRRRNHQ